jgi:hypothetical protein
VNVLSAKDKNFVPPPNHDTYTHLGPIHARPPSDRLEEKIVHVRFSILSLVPREVEVTYIKPFAIPKK